MEILPALLLQNGTNQPSWMDWIRTIGPIVTILGGVYALYRWRVGAIESYESYRRRVLSWYADRKIGRLDAKRNDVELYKFLEWRYRDYGEILRRDGGRMIYPAAVFAVSEGQRSNVNSILGTLKLTQKDSKHFMTNDGTYRRIRGYSQMTLPPEKRAEASYNYVSYDMSRIIRVGNALKIDCSIGCFYHLMDTCYSLEWELLHKWRGIKQGPESEKVKQYKAFSRRLRLRNKLHQQVNNPLRDGSSRSAGIAVSGLIAYRDSENRIRLIVKSRSAKTVALYPGATHVAPSGQYQPIADLEPRMEFENRQFGGVKLGFFKEYLEELLGEKDPTAPSSQEERADMSRYPWEKTYSNRKLGPLLNALRDGEAEFLLTGIMVNLLSLQPEVCTLLYIKSDSWVKTHIEDENSDMNIKFNSEWATKRHEKIPHGALFYSDDDREMINSAKRLYPCHFVPNGAASFWLGIDVLRDLLKREKENV